MQFGHWLIAAGACLVLVGSVGLAFRNAEPLQNNLKQAAPPNPLRLAGANAGPKTVREVRGISGETLLSFRDLGKGALADLREAPGPPLSDGVGPSDKKPG
jgi:hypothetical protein